MVTTYNIDTYESKRLNSHHVYFSYPDRVVLPFSILFMVTICGLTAPSGEEILNYKIPFNHPK
jgi:hypothetical protein